MTRIWSVNANNDIFTRPGGRLAIDTDLQAVLQLCEHAMKAQLNEMIYARNRGINYELHIFDGSPNLLGFEADARRQLNRIPDVVSVASFDANLVGNTIEYTATIQTVFGIGSITNADPLNLPQSQGVGINGRL